MLLDLRLPNGFACGLGHEENDALLLLHDETFDGHKADVCLAEAYAIAEKGTTVVDESLTELENCYPSYFFRVHRGALISRKHLRGLERTNEGQTQVLLSGTDRKPEVSRRNVSALRKLLSEIS